MRNPAFLAVVAMVTVAAAVSGCAKSKASPRAALSVARPSPGASGGPLTLGGPTPTATVTVPSGPGNGGNAPGTGGNNGLGGGGSGSGGSGSGGAGSAPNYPTTPKAYGQDAVNAYAKGNQTLIAAYASGPGVTALTNLGKSNSPYAYDDSGPDGGYVACDYYNYVGDQVTVTIDQTLLGKAHAVLNAVIDRTSYPNSADQMINVFLNAWLKGNDNRMLALSNGETAGRFIAGGDRDGKPTSGWTLSDDTNLVPGKTAVTIHRVDGGDNINLLVDNSKLGSAHAIDDGAKTA